MDKRGSIQVSVLEPVFSMYIKRKCACVVSLGDKKRAKAKSSYTEVRRRCRPEGPGPIQD